MHPFKEIPYYITVILQHNNSTLAETMVFLLAIYSNIVIFIGKIKTCKNQCKNIKTRGFLDKNN